MTKVFRLVGVCLFFVCLSSVIFARGNDPIAKVKHGNDKAIYKKGEPITWVLTADKLTKSEAKKVHFVLKHRGVEVVQEGDIDFTVGSKKITTSLDKPGSVLLILTVGKKKQLSGAFVNPKEIKPSMPKPADFDKFWAEKLAEQEKVPMNPVLSLEKSMIPEADSWIITLDTIRGQKIQGRLAKPKGNKKLPAILRLQYAGVYGISSKGVLNNAKEGWLVLNILAHDEPINKEKSYYDQLRKGKLKSYKKIGNADREKSYFLRMDLACSRAVDYLASHPNWDGKTLLASGGSQGGYQAIVAAGLNSKVTAVIANVPAGCDITSILANRAIAWPYWLAGDKKNKKKANAARYFDAVNFAYNIKCDVLISFGLADTTSRPAGIYSMINGLQGNVQMIVEPDQGHKGSYRKFYRGIVPAYKNKILKAK